MSFSLKLRLGRTLFSIPSPQCPTREQTRFSPADLFAKKGLGAISNRCASSCKKVVFLARIKMEPFLLKGLESERWDLESPWRTGTWEVRSVWGSCFKPHDVYQRCTQLFYPWGDRRMCGIPLCLCFTIMLSLKTYLGDKDGWLFKQASGCAGFWYGRPVISDSLGSVHLCLAWGFSAAALKLGSAVVSLPQCGVTKPGWLPVLGDWHWESYIWDALREGISSTLEFSLSSVTVCHEAQMLLCLLKLWAESFGVDHYQEPTAKRGFYWGKGGKEGSVSEADFWMAWI